MEVNTQKVSNAELPHNQGRVQLGCISVNPAAISMRLVRIRMPYREFTGVFFYKHIHRADLFLPPSKKRKVERSFLRRVLLTNHSVAPAESALKSALMFKKARRVSAGHIPLLEVQFLIKFLQDFGFAVYAGQVHGGISIKEITQFKIGTAGYNLRLNSTFLDGTAAPRKMVSQVAK